MATRYMVPPLWEGTLLLFNPWIHGFLQLYPECDSDLCCRVHDDDRVRYCVQHYTHPYIQLYGATVQPRRYHRSPLAGQTDRRQVPDARVVCDRFSLQRSVVSRLDPAAHASRFRMLFSRAGNGRLVISCASTGVRIGDDVESAIT